MMTLGSRQIDKLVSRYFRKTLCSALIGSGIDILRPLVSFSFFKQPKEWPSRTFSQELYNCRKLDSYAGHHLL